MAGQTLSVQGKSISVFQIIAVLTSSQSLIALRSIATRKGPLEVFFQPRSVERWLDGAFNLLSHVFSLTSGRLTPRTPGTLTVCRVILLLSHHNETSTAQLEREAERVSPFMLL